MIRSSRFIIAAFILSFLFSQCSNDEIEPDFDRVGFSFFPVKVGNWRVYEVNRSTFRIFGDTLVENFQLREEIVDFFINSENDTTYILHRSKRLMDSDDFELDSVWSVRRTPNQAIVIENNAPIVKLGFPIKDGLSWDANVLNTMEEEIHEMDDLGFELTVGGITFTNTLRVIQSDVQDTIIRFDQRFDHYALNVGLIQSSGLILNYCSTIDCLGMGIVESGLNFEQELIDYGPK